MIKESMYLIEFSIVCLIVVAIVSMAYSAFAFKPKQPENFDSMLCDKHAPTATILVTDLVIKCTNGKRYEVIE